MRKAATFTYTRRPEGAVLFTGAFPSTIIETLAVVSPLERKRTTDHVFNLNVGYALMVKLETFPQFSKRIHLDSSGGKIYSELEIAGKVNYHG